jgi:hypothetical protein
MDERDWLAERFEEHRGRLHAVVARSGRAAVEQHRIGPQRGSERQALFGASGLSDDPIAPSDEQLGDKPPKLPVVVDDEHGRLHEPSVAWGGPSANRANPTSRHPRLRDTPSVSVPDSEQYAHMLDAAAADGYAYPAVNVSSSETLDAAMRGFSPGRVRRHGGADYGRRRVCVRRRCW